ncbi:hypothetical protein WJX84_012474 [Apatococcus fuscideae]|uniref:Uncharacterized protein n=1 Tax=Apatococcus fuscideae TaxID=2026836 RepID=A0AAW1S405_9CHLO
MTAAQSSGGLVEAAGALEASADKSGAASGDCGGLDSAKMPPEQTASGTNTTGRSVRSVRSNSRGGSRKRGAGSQHQALAARNEAARKARTNQSGSPAGRRERASGQTATSPAAGAPAGPRASPRLQGRQTRTQESDDPEQTSEDEPEDTPITSCVVLAPTRGGSDQGAREDEYGSDMQQQFLTTSTLETRDVLVETKESAGDGASDFATSTQEIGFKSHLQSTLLAHNMYSTGRIYESATAKAMEP